ncbi:MAG TPA: hypothetical protein DCE23_04315 [Firmicutes bacterium]|nr:hypothetical protein [Bacillota bacterium]
MDGIERIKVLAAEVEDDDLLEIVNYLISREDMNEKYLNEEKSLKQMCEFINNTARDELLKKHKVGFEGHFISNDKVFGWAIHYWDESNKDLGIKSKEELEQELEEIKLHNKEQAKLRKEQKNKVDPEIQKLKEEIESKEQKEVPKKKEWVPEGQLSLF